MTRSAKGTVEVPGRNVRAKAGLNREILRSGWGQVVARLQDKAPGRVQKVAPAYTSQRCAACGHIAAGSRERQALFRCVACGYTLNTDVNAAKNIAAGHAVTARGRQPGYRAREPRTSTAAPAGVVAGIPVFRRGRRPRTDDNKADLTHNREAR
jgi:putative transposase